MAVRRPVARPIGALEAEASGGSPKARMPAGNPLQCWGLHELVLVARWTVGSGANSRDCSMGRSKALESLPDE